MIKVRTKLIADMRFMKVLEFRRRFLPAARDEDSECSKNASSIESDFLSIPGPKNKIPEKFCIDEGGAEKVKGSKVEGDKNSQTVIVACYIFTFCVQLFCLWSSRGDGRAGPNLIVFIATHPPHRIKTSLLILLLLLAL
jgi:hypothetical protein